MGTSLPSPVVSLGNVKDVEFVEKLDEKYKCIQCHQVLESPMQTRCGHRICQACLRTLLQNSPGGVTCPGGEDTCELLVSEQVYPDFGVQRELLALPVYCSFKSNGCPETVPWKNLQSHLETCPYEVVDCLNKQAGCLEKIFKSKLHKHCTEECNYRNIKCHECDQLVISHYFKVHLQRECPNMIIKCPYGCGKSLQRSLLEEHSQNCPSRPLECKYKTFGCPFTGLQSDLQEHEQHGLAQHLEIVVHHFMKVNLKNTEMQAKLEEALGMNAHLKAELEKRRREIEDLRKKCQGLETTCVDNKKSMEAFNRQMVSVVQKLTTLAPKQDLERQQSAIASLQEEVNNMKTYQPNKVSTGASKRGASRGQDTGQFENQFIQLNIHVAELEMRCKYLESTSFNGVLIWKITDYARRKREAKQGTNRGIYSSHFYSSKCGYKVCARIYLNGDGQGIGTHVSLFFVVMRGEYDAILPWPFRHKVVLTLLSQTNDRHHTDFFRPDISSSSFQRPSSDMNVASGCPMFVPQRVLENSQYLVDDSVFIKVEIEDCKV